MIRSIIYLVSFIMMAQLFVGVAEARQVVKSKNLSAHVSDSFRCSEQISLTIKAPNSSYFTKHNTEVQRLVGSARSILGFECGKIKKINISGKVNNQVVYQGRSYASESWMVISGGTKTLQPKQKSISTASKPTQKQFFAPGEKRLSAQGSVAVYISNDYKCGETTQLTIRAPESSFFHGDNIKLRRLIDPVSRRLASECKELNQINVIGLVGEKQVYQGRKMASKRWILFTVPKQYADKKGIIIGKDDELIVYQDKNLTIKGPHIQYASDWCGSENRVSTVLPSARLRSFYEVDHFKRHVLFSPTYEDFLQNNIIPLIEDYCGEVPPFIELSMIDIQNKNQSWDTLTFRVINGNAIRKAYSPPVPSKTESIDKKKLEAHIKKMSPTPNDMRKIRGQPIFSNEALKIYSHDGIPLDHKNWKRQSALDIVYNFERKSTYRSSKARDLASILFPIIGKYYTGILRVYYYNKDEKEYLDKVTYKFSGGRHNKPGYLEVQNRSLGPVLKKQAEEREANYFGQCDGPFCDLPGGKYLNAIYRNDTAVVDAIDKTYPYGSYLVHIANQYMFNYGKTVYYNGRSSYNSMHSRKCLGLRARSKTFSYTTDVKRYENIYGMDMGSIGGDKISATYTVNPEFYPLLLKIGGHFGDSLEKLRASMNKKLEVVLDGARKIQATCDCSSPEVKQFERNLISLTTRYLQRKLAEASASQ